MPRTAPLSLAILVLLSAVTLAPSALACPAAPHSFSLSASTTQLPESAGSWTVVVTRAGNLDCESSVDYAVIGLTATAGSDFTSASGTLTFPFGTSTRTIVVAILNDNVPEPDETLEVVLTNPQGTQSGLGAVSRLTLTILDDDGTPSLQLSPATIEFGVQLVGTISSARTLTLTNTGDGRALSMSVSASQTVQWTTTCGTALAAGESCTIEVRVQPVVSGFQSATVRVQATPGGSVSSTLTGTGTVPGASLSTSLLAFGDQAVGTQTRQFATLRNPGTATLNIASIVATGDFRVEHACAAQLAPGAQCALDVIFAPTELKERTGEIVVTSDAPGDARRISLTGSGTDAATAPRLTLSRADGGALSALDLGRIEVGKKSEIRVEIRNGGDTPLAIKSVEVRGDAAFTKETNCPSFIAKTTGCYVIVRIAPAAAGAFTGELFLLTNSDGSPERIPLRAESYDPDRPSALTLDPAAGASLSWSDVRVGATGEARAVELRSTGGDAVVIREIRSTNSAMIATHACPARLAPSESCRIDVTFSPTVAGIARGTLVIEADVAGAPFLLDLEGSAVQAAAPRLRVTQDGSAAGAALADRISWSDVGVGSGSTRSLTLANDGDAALTLDVSITGAAFAHTTTCPATLSPGATCTVDVTYTPPTATAHEGALVIAHNADGAPRTVILAGAAVSGGGLLDPVAGGAQTDDLDAKTPAPALALVLAIFGAVALATRRRNW